MTCKNCYYSRATLHSQYLQCHHKRYDYDCSDSTYYRKTQSYVEPTDHCDCYRKFEETVQD